MQAYTDHVEIFSTELRLLRWKLVSCVSQSSKAFDSQSSMVVIREGFRGKEDNLEILVQFVSFA